MGKKSGKSVQFWIQKSAQALFTVSKGRGLSIEASVETVETNLRKELTFPCKMKPEEQAQKFHTDDVSLLRSGFL